MKFDLLEEYLAAYSWKMNFVRTSELLVRKHTACNNFLSLLVLKLPVKRNPFFPIKSISFMILTTRHDMSKKKKERERKENQTISGGT